jgi:hypothetical protein
MEAILTRHTHKITIHLHVVIAVPFAALLPGGQSGNFGIHPRILKDFFRKVAFISEFLLTFQVSVFWVVTTCADLIRY